MTVHGQAEGAHPMHAAPKGTYAWRMAAVNSQGKLLSPWTPEQTVTLK